MFVYYNDLCINVQQLVRLYYYFNVKQQENMLQCWCLGTKSLSFPNSINQGVLSVLTF